MAKSNLEYYNLSELKELGWNDNLINDILGEPDRLKKNPKYASAAPSKLFETARVNEAMQSSIFIWHRYSSDKTLGSVEKRRMARQKTNEELYQNGLDLLSGIYAGVRDLGCDRILIETACNHYNNLQYSRGRYDFQEATKNSPKDFLDRICVNYLYHTCDLVLAKEFPSDFQECLAGSKRLRGEARSLLDGKIFLEIGQRYPQLKKACQQKQRRNEEFSQMADDYFSSHERPKLSKKSVNLSQLNSSNVSIEQFEDAVLFCKKKGNWTDKKWATVLATLSQMSKEQLLVIQHFAWRMDNKRWFFVHGLQKLKNKNLKNIEQFDRFLQKSLTEQNFGRVDFLFRGAKQKYIKANVPLQMMTSHGNIPGNFFKKWLKSMELTDKNIGALVGFCREHGRHDLLKMIDVSKVTSLRKQLIKEWSETGEERPEFWTWAQTNCIEEIVGTFKEVLNKVYNEPLKQPFNNSVMNFIEICLQTLIDGKIVEEAFLIYKRKTLPAWAFENFSLKSVHEKFNLLDALGEKIDHVKKQREL